MTTKKYRTQKQFIQIIENASNNNWSDAFKGAEEYGFYAHDLVEHYEKLKDEININIVDLIYIAEGAQKLR